jgi:hypothetical protein
VDVRIALALPALFALASCGNRLVRVVPDGPSPYGGTSVAPSDRTFEVEVWTAGAKDPLPVSGAGVVFGDLQRALGQAVLRNVRPRHDTSLDVELVSAEATYARSRLDVSLVARVTLRARQGNDFLAQTQVVCRESALVQPDSGAPVVWSCMERLGRDLGGWLDGLPSH